VTFILQYIFYKRSLDRCNHLQQTLDITFGAQCGARLHTDEEKRTMSQDEEYFDSAVIGDVGQTSGANRLGEFASLALSEGAVGWQADAAGADGNGSGEVGASWQSRSSTERSSGGETAQRVVGLEYPTPAASSLLPVAAGAGGICRGVYGASWQLRSSTLRSPSGDVVRQILSRLEYSSPAGPSGLLGTAGAGGIGRGTVGASWQLGSSTGRSPGGDAAKRVVSRLDYPSPAGQLRLPAVTGVGTRGDSQPRRRSLPVPSYGQHVVHSAVSSPAVISSCGFVGRTGAVGSSCIGSCFVGSSFVVGRTVTVGSSCVVARHVAYNHLL